MLVSILLLFAAMNVVAFSAFGWDKLCAVRRWKRVPERQLLEIAFVGGALGALIGQRLFRHKTVKEPFRTLLRAASVFNLFALLVIVLIKAG